MAQKITDVINLGGHISTSGGIELSPDRAIGFSFRSFQLFSKNQMQWKAKPLGIEEIDLFKDSRRKNNISHVMIHASYLLNSATSDQELKVKVMEGLKLEIERADLLEADSVTYHPGSRKDASLEQGIRNVTSILNTVLKEEQNVKVLIENSAGQGNSVGKTFQELSMIIDGIELKDKIGICFDTCHAWAAGYELVSMEGYAETMDDLKSNLGMKYLAGFHMNDSKKGKGSNVDRHEQIGMGTIGLDGFRNFVYDEEIRGKPMILETPKGEEGYMEDITQLNSILR
ncbi:MAG: deoxyribonuclease IV [Thermoplasmataceae archaeon]